VITILLSNIDKEGPAAGKDQQTQQKSGTAFRRHGETWFSPVTTNGNRNQTKIEVH